MRRHHVRHDYLAILNLDALSAYLRQNAKCFVWQSMFGTGGSQRCPVRRVMRPWVSVRRGAKPCLQTMAYRGTVAGDVFSCRSVRSGHGSLRLGGLALTFEREADSVDARRVTDLLASRGVDIQRELNEKLLGLTPGGGPWCTLAIRSGCDGRTDLGKTESMPVMKPSPTLRALYLQEDRGRYTARIHPWAVARSAIRSRRITPGVHFMRLLTVLVAVVLPTTTVSAQRAIPTWSLQPEMRIGSADDGPYALNDVGYVVVSPKTGAVFLAQYEEIRVFSADGRYLRSIGREGSGPGEFTRLVGLGWSGDLLVAFKRNPGNAMHFTEGGALTEDRRINVETRLEGISAGRGYPFATLEGGNYLWAGSVDPTPGARSFAPIVRTNGEGNDQLLDRLAQAPIWRQAPLTGVQPLTGPSLISADPQGSAFVVVHQHPPNGRESATFRVRKINAAGRVLFARIYHFEPRAVPPTFGDSLIRAGVEVIQAYRPMPDLEATLRRLTRIPRFQPPVTDVLLAVDGSIWLRREDLDLATVTWWILDQRGDLQGQLSLPAKQRIKYVDGDTVWAVEFDSLDVPYAVRYRIRR